MTADMLLGKYEKRAAMKEELEVRKMELELP